MTEPKPYTKKVTVGWRQNRGRQEKPAPGSVSRPPTMVGGLWALVRSEVHEAKTHLSRLIEMAVHGEPFIIAKAGKPLVIVIALEQGGPRPEQRLGFLLGQFQIPEDFDRMGNHEVAELFEGVNEIST